MTRLRASKCPKIRTFRFRMGSKSEVWYKEMEEDIDTEESHVKMRQSFAATLKPPETRSRKELFPISLEGAMVLLSL